MVCLIMHRWINHNEMILQNTLSKVQTNHIKQTLLGAPGYLFAQEMSGWYRSCKLKAGSHISSCRSLLSWKVLNWMNIAFLLIREPLTHRNNFIRLLALTDLCWKRTANIQYLLSIWRKNDQHLHANDIYQRMNLFYTVCCKYPICPAVAKASEIVSQY